MIAPLRQNEVAALTIECTVIIDGIAGVLLEKRSNSPEPIRSSPNGPRVRVGAS